MFVVLASEPVGWRSRTTKLPCLEFKVTMVVKCVVWIEPSSFE